MGWVVPVSPALQQTEAKMRKQLIAHFSCLLVLLVVGTTGIAATMQKLHLDGHATATTPTCRVLTADSKGLTLELEIPFLNQEELEVDGVSYQLVSLPGGGFRGQEGEAALPIWTRLVALPEQVTVQARVLSQDIQAISGIHVAPHQPASAEQFQKNEGYYARKGLDEAPLVVVGQPAFIRDLRVVPVTFQPVRYDPSQDKIEVSRRMTVELTFDGTNPTAGTGKEMRYIPESFYNLYRDIVLNFETDGAEVGPGSYLIICPDNASIIAAIDPLLDWRRRQGYNVILATTSETGTTNAQIKSYIQTVYNRNEIPLEFVCLVGDATGSYAVATWFEGLSGYGGEGDHYYTNLAGSDVLSDIHIGRLSHRNVTELQNIVDKIVTYESDPWLTNDPDWFTRACLTGDPYTPSGWSTVYISQWAKEQLIDLGYTQIDTIWGGNFPTLMQASLNQGGTLFTYRGYLGMSSYTTGHADALSNGYKLHFAVVLTCGTGSFSDDTHSPSEAFLRSANGGGVASMGLATWGTHTRYNNCLFNGVIEGALNMGDYRVGPAQTRGKLEMYINYQANEPHEVEIWSVWNNLMGDPATEIWTAYPKDLYVDHLTSVAVGASSVAITVTGSGSVPVEGAKVSLYKAGEILVSGYSDETGRVMLPLTSHTAGQLQVTVTKHDFKPYLGNLTLGSANTYLSSSGTSVDDDTSGQSYGNGDGLLNPGETIEYSVEVENLGTTSAPAVVGVLTTTDPYVTLISDQQSYGDIPAGGSVWRQFVFSLDVGTPDGHVVQFALDATSGSDTWTSLVEATITSGACAAGGPYQFGGPGGSPDPGEAGTLSIALTNIGSVDIGGITATLTSDTPWISVTDADGSYGFIGQGQSAENTGNPFAISITSDCYQGHMASFYVELEFSSGAVDTAEFQMTVGNIHSYDPVGPDQYGYYAFDNTDNAYQYAPVYNWVEIDPDYGGSGTSIGLSDFGEYQDDTQTIDLPFTFKFYGNDFDQISVCSNGWLCMGASYLVLYRNWSIPNAGGPDDLVAVYWDNLYQNTSSDVLYWYDVANHRFIVEWSRMRNDVGGYEETFEAILYDPAFHVTDSGDGLIICQYETVNVVDSINGYTTVGIQNGDHSDGLLYTYWNRYAGGAAGLASGRAIAYQAVLAQPQGYLEGDVTNASGGGSPIEGAIVKVIETGRSIVTQDTGHYYGSSPAGVYTIAVSHESFEPDTTYNVTIEVDEVTNLDYSLTDILGPYLQNVTNYGGTDDTVGPYDIEVNITDHTAVAEMHFYYTSSNDGGRPHEVTLQLVDAETGLYKAGIPGQPLGTRVQYWLTAKDPLGNESTAPVGAPWQNYTFMVAASEDVFVDDMESDQGWTVGDAGDNASTGIWTRVDPNGVWEGGTLIQPEDDATPAPGIMCWITGNDPPGSNQGTDDVDGGKTTILTPWFDISSYQGVSLTYKRWFTNDTGSSPGQDPWVVEVTNNGSQWVDLESTTTSNRSWLTQNFLLEDYIEITSTVRLRFVARDDSPGSVVEAGVDDFVLQGHEALYDTEAPMVNLRDPNGGEMIPRGVEFRIHWDASDDIGVVKTHILFSTDGGLSYPDTIASGALDSLLLWQVPDFTAPDCRIKVVVLDALQNETFDVCDGSFAITEATDVDDIPIARLALEQNRPNPFNPRTEIKFSLPKEQHLTLRIYDVEGRLVNTLVDERRLAGVHRVVWSGNDNAGARVSSGLYFYRLITEDGQVMTRKMMLLK